MLKSPSSDQQVSCACDGKATLHTSERWATSFSPTYQCTMLAGRRIYFVLYFGTGHKGTLASKFLLSELGSLIPRALNSNMHWALSWKRKTRVTHVLICHLLRNVETLKPQLILHSCIHCTGLTCETCHVMGRL